MVSLGFRFELVPLDLPDAASAVIVPTLRPGEAARLRGCEGCEGCEGCDRGEQRTFVVVIPSLQAVQGVQAVQSVQAVQPLAPRADSACAMRSSGCLWQPIRPAGALFLPGY